MDKTLGSYRVLATQLNTITRSSKKSPQLIMVVSSGSAVSGLLYSLIHLGGFAGDISFYRTRCGDAGRVVEFGCGDGRIAAALCLGESPLTVLQQQRQHDRSGLRRSSRLGGLQ